MSGRTVLFLALGATRRRAVVEESAQVVAGGGRALVVIRAAGHWRKETFASGVEVVELTRLELRRFPMWAENLLLFRAPGFIFHALGRGPLTSLSRRAGKAYERRVARPVHQRVWLPVYHRLRRHGPAELVRQHVLGDVSVDLLVVSDPVSMPLAARLVSDDAQAPLISYSLGDTTTVDGVAHDMGASRVPETL